MFCCFCCCFSCFEKDNKNENRPYYNHCCCCLPNLRDLCCCLCSGNEICNCCSFIIQKCCQISYIISIFISLIFLVVDLIIISWGKFPAINLTLFIIISLSIVALLILGFLLYCYTYQNNVQMNPIINNSVNSIKIAGLIITIICLVFSVVEEIFLTLSFTDAKNAYPCTKESSPNFGFFVFKKNSISERLLSSNNNNDNNNYQCYDEFVTAQVYALSYFTLTLIEIICIFGCFFWSHGIHCNSCCPNQRYINNQNINNMPAMMNNQMPVIIINQGNNLDQIYQQQLYSNNINTLNQYGNNQYNNY